jgi:hydrogenase expression/formation protein HypE
MRITTVQLSHGSGAGLHALLNEIIYPALAADQTGPFEDAAVLSCFSGRPAFTTDAFVVDPLEFPGGDIGKLSACGTINDLAMMGARPRFMAVALILEEGLDAALLSRVLSSLRRVCDDAGVRISCGDTKVVDRGKADGMFITTTGIGEIAEARALSAANCKEGDAVIVSGGIGLHGIAILAARKKLSFASDAISDCAPLWDIADRLLHAVPTVRVLRDATRGGVAAVLNEIADDSQVTMRLTAKAIPVPEVVRGACSFLGMDPLQIANEGRFIAVVPADRAEKAIDTLRNHALGRDAAIIGTVEKRGRFPVLLTTDIGGTRVVELPPGELLPRIC